MDFPKNVFDALQQQLASTGRIGATRVVQTPPVASPAFGQISTPAAIRFPQWGIALAMYGQDAQADAVSYAQDLVRCQIGGTEDLFVDGQGGPAYIPMLALFGGQNNWFPLLRRVQPGVDWVFTFQNQNTGSGVIAPSITISVIYDQDVANMLAAAQQAGSR